MVCARGRSLFAANPANYYVRHEHLLIENHRMWIPMWQKAGRKTRGFPETHGWHFGLRVRVVLCQRAARRAGRKRRKRKGRGKLRHYAGRKPRARGQRGKSQNLHPSEPTQPNQPTKMKHNSHNPGRGATASHQRWAIWRRLGSGGAANGILRRMSAVQRKGGNPPPPSGPKQ